MPQLLQNERNLIDKMVRSQGKMPVEAWKALKKARAKKTVLWDDVRRHRKT